MQTPEILSSPCFTSSTFHVKIHTSIHPVILILSYHLSLLRHTTVAVNLSSVNSVTKFIRSFTGRSSSIRVCDSWRSFRCMASFSVAAVFFSRPLLDVIISCPSWGNFMGCQYDNLLNLSWWVYWSTKHRTASSAVPDGWLPACHYDRPPLTLIIQCHYMRGAKNSRICNESFTVARRDLWTILPLHLHDAELTLTELHCLLKMHQFSWRPPCLMTAVFRGSTNALT